jgi:hypothetical protein
MKRLLAIIVGLVMLFCVSCTDQLSETTPTYDYESRVYGSTWGAAMCWNRFVVSGWDNKIYDRATGEVYNFCEEPECDGTCLLERSSCEISQLRDGVLYFSAYEFGTGDTYYCSRDMLTGETTVYFSVPRNELDSFGAMFTCGDWIYYTQRKLMEGGNSSNPNDYQPCLFRFPVSGGNSEVYYPMRGNSEILWLIADGFMITTYQGGIWYTDLETLTPKLIITMDQMGLPGLAQIQCVNNRLYFITNPEGNLIAAPNGLPVNQPRLVTVDIETGEWKFLVEVPVVTYHITNEAVYFSPVEIRQMNDPEIYPPVSAEAKFFAASATLYACDLDGSNIREVWTDDSNSFDFVEYYTVVDNIFYGILFKFDQNQNKFGDYYYAEIHFDTGEIIPATIIE